MSVYKENEIPIASSSIGWTKCMNCYKFPLLVFDSIATGKKKKKRKMRYKLIFTPCKLYHFPGTC